MKSSNLWTKDFLIDSGINFLVFYVFFLLMVTIVPYATDTLQASTSEAGLASGIFVLGTLAARIFAGRSIERIGRKKLLYIGLSSFFVTTLLYFAVNNLSVLFIVRFLHGVGFGITATATATIITNIIPLERRGEGISYYMMSTTLASATGPFLGMMVSQQGSFNIILGSCVVLTGMSLLAAFFLKVVEVELTQEQQASMQGFTVANFVELKAIPISLVAILIGFSYSSILSFLTSYIKAINLVYAGSFFYVVFSAVTLISRPVTGRWFDRKGENCVMYPVFIVFAAGLVILSQAQQGFSLLVAGAFIGLGYGTFLSCAQAIAVKVSPSHRMGLANSTYYILLDTGIGVGPFLLGFLIPVTGFRGLYIGMAVVALVGSLVYHFLHGRKAATCEEQLVTES
ncbi:MAG: major facilitator superfamily protein [Firmicutes bacterium]|nr:major facilitator superfamily protein [Bacillota bacterium]